jgi:hypothetical protein
MPTSPGRPRSLDPSKRSTIDLLISFGVSRKSAARYVGVAPCTLRREELRNPTFARDLADAELGFEFQMLNAMFEAAKTQPGAAEWIRQHVDTTLDDVKLPARRRPALSQPPPASAQKGHQFCTPSDNQTPVNPSSKPYRKQEIKLTPNRKISRTARNSPAQRVP